MLLNTSSGRALQRSLALALVIAGIVGCSNSSGGPTGKAQFLASTNNAFIDFDAKPGVSSVQLIEITEPFPSTAFTIDADSAITKLDVSGAPIDPIGPSFKFDTNLGNLTVAKLNIQSQGLALITTSLSNTGAGAAIYLFNPSTAKAPGDFLKVDLTGKLSINATGLVDAAGNASGVFDANFPIGAAIVTQNNGSDRLFVGFSNPDTNNNFVARPSAVLVYDIAFDIAGQVLALARVAGAPGTIFTSQYNPKDMGLFSTSQGPILAVTNDGSSNATFAKLLGGLDFINPLTNIVVSNVPLGNKAPDGRLTLSGSGTRGYLGSLSTGGNNQIFEIDTTSLGTVLVNNTVQNQPGRLMSTFEAPLPNGVGFDQFPRPVVSGGGRFVYTLASFSRRLLTFDVLNPTAPIDALDLTANRPAGGQFTDTFFYMDSRPGDPSSALFVVASFVDPSNQAITGVESALDVIIPRFR